MRGPKKNVRGPAHPLAQRKAHPLRDDDEEPVAKSRAPTGRAKGFAHLQAGRVAKPAPASPDPRPRTPAPELKRPLDGEGRPYITLAQLLKMVKLVESGGEAKHRVRAGDLLVNGQPETRPGRKLHAGDTVTIDGDELTVDLGDQ